MRTNKLFTKDQIFENIKRQDWQNFMVKHIDYLARPSIQHKNSAIIEEFLSNHLRHLEEETIVFNTIKCKITQLMTECYIPSQQMYHKGPFTHFENKKALVEDQVIVIHEPGIKQDITS